MVGTTKFTIAAIPLGGYVEIAGMDGNEATGTVAGEEPFSKKPYYQKFCIMMGGILFNIILAFKMAMLVYLFGAPGSILLYPETATTVVERVLPDTIAAQQGIQAGDVIIKFNDVELDNRAEKLITHLKTTHEPVTITFEHDGTMHTTEPITVIPGTPFGVLLKTEKLQPYGFVESISHAWKTTVRWIRDTGYGLLHILRKADLSSAGGPVKIISMISQSAQDGILIYLLLLALISINLALFNLIPVPILDGGQLLLATIESLIGRPLPIKVREYIFIGTWLLFIGLILVLSFQDLAVILKPYLQTIKQCIPLSLVGD
jgi:regulator of sigma E protease